jgi:E3 ubiquitin-protein ligase MARCH5
MMKECFYLGPLVYTLDLIERILNRFCPFLAGGILVGSVYWTAVTYGAVTIMQVGNFFIRLFSIEQKIVFFSC